MTRNKDPFARFAVTRPSQLVTKSDQWYDDARFLHRSKRYAAAMYLGGFVVECLLKRALWGRRSEPAVRKLFFASHDLAELLDANKDLASRMQADRTRAYDQFVQLTSWTVRFRYNPRKPHADDARVFMRRLKETRE
ncbi:MAG: hypothetical protein PVI86_12610 [Phycisphaerae bacterium]|jgi:hypothetical protein